MAVNRDSFGNIILTKRQWEVLYLLNSYRAPTMTEIGNKVGLPRSNVYAVIDRLCQLGYAECICQDRARRKYRSSAFGRRKCREKKRRIVRARIRKYKRVRDQRDRWFYHHAMRGVPATLLLDMQYRKPKQWPRVDSSDAICNRVRIFAARHNLPLPSPGRSIRYWWKSRKESD